MRTAVDTSVLLDVLLPDPVHGQASARLLEQAYDEGALIVSDPVYAELVPQFSSRRQLDGALEVLGLEVSSGSREIAYEAGKRFSRYRRAGGPRARILTDFLIAAHALHLCDRFLTRDRGFYRTYFPELRLLV